MDMEQGEKHDGTSITFHDVHFTMREYQSLQDQHEELCQRLSALCPPSKVPPSRSRVNRGKFSQVKPTEPSFKPSIQPPIPELQTTSSRTPTSCPSSDGVTPDVNDSLVEQVAAGEQMLSNVNEGIKRALTELLNCDVVRQNVHTRSWVQTRLLETERELRRGRRRRSSGSSDSSAAVD